MCLQPVVLGYNQVLLQKQLTPWSRAFDEKLTVAQLVKKFPAFIEPKGSLSFEISGSHIDEYEDVCLLGCCAMCCLSAWRIYLTV
jgi:hypothetical protein